MLQRLSLELPGIRPAFLPANRLVVLRELKGFRHFIRHAYDLTLRADRLQELTDIVRRLARDLPVWCEDFKHRVQNE